MTIERKTLESDSAVRDATFEGVITFLQMRQVALVNSREKKLPDADMIEQARDSARNELIYRYQAALHGKATGEGLKHMIRAIGSIGLAIETDYLVPDSGPRVDEIVRAALTSKP